MSGHWTPGNIGPAYSQAESSAVVATKVSASPVVSIVFQPMAEGAAPTGAGFVPMPPPFFQPPAFSSSGTLVHMTPTYTTTLRSMATPAQRNIFSTPHEYVPPSSLGMPPEMMVSSGPNASSSRGATFASQQSPQVTRPMVLFQQPSSPQVQQQGDIRFGLSTDEMNPFGEWGRNHSTWSVTLSMFNLPSWLCMRRKYILMPVLIQGC